MWQAWQTPMTGCAGSMAGVNLYINLICTYCIGCAAVSALFSEEWRCVWPKQYLFAHALPVTCLPTGAPFPALYCVPIKFEVNFSKCGTPAPPTTHHTPHPFTLPFYRWQPLALFLGSLHRFGTLPTAFSLWPHIWIEFIWTWTLNQCFITVRGQAVVVFTKTIVIPIPWPVPRPVPDPFFILHFSLWFGFWPVSGLLSQPPAFVAAVALLAVVDMNGMVSGPNIILAGQCGCFCSWSWILGSLVHFLWCYIYLINGQSDVFISMFCVRVEREFENYWLGLSGTGTPVFGGGGGTVSAGGC